MKIALLSDIHGNMAALSAVLADLGGERVDQFICLGDIASGGPQPREVIAKLRELAVPIVMGNTDYRLMNQGVPDNPSDHVRKLIDIEAWIRATVPAAELAPLAEAPLTLTLELDNGQRLLCCHGSPRSRDERLVAGIQDEELAPAFNGHEFDLLAAGHTHLTMLRYYHQSLVINPGTVGSPTLGLGPVASYALLTTDGANVSVDFRRVGYDITPAVQAALSSGMPHGDWWISSWR
ncbi:MAG: metallophosphoesterase family protein [Bacillota bacterium]